MKNRIKKEIVKRGMEIGKGRRKAYTLCKKLKKDS